MKKFVKCFLILFLTLTFAKNVYTPVFAENTVQMESIKSA